MIPQLASILENGPSRMQHEQSLHTNLRRLQKQVEELYDLERGPDVSPFVRIDVECDYETVLVSQEEDSVLELMLVLPASLDPGAPIKSDEHLQMIEGVSHFVHLSERARTDLPTTQLELELQAEVDKFYREHHPAVLREATRLAKSRADVTITPAGRRLTPGRDRA